jgi:endonuclease YncB( thermonuclease family)
VGLYLQFSSIPSCIDGDNFSFFNGNQLEGNERRLLSEALSLRLSGGTKEEREKATYDGQYQEYGGVALNLTATFLSLFT